jgi:hypothetical protein
MLSRLNATRKIVLLLWLPLVASLGNVSALTRSAWETRTWTPVGGVIYDLNGNTRTNHGGQWLYFYDAENRLSQFYRYDTVNPRETQFVYDGLGRLRKRLLGAILG